MTWIISRVCSTAFESERPLPLVNCLEVTEWDYLNFKEKIFLIEFYQWHNSALAMCYFHVESYAIGSS